MCFPCTENLLQYTCILGVDFNFSKLRIQEKRVSYNSGTNQSFKKHCSLNGAQRKGMTAWATFETRIGFFISNRRTKPGQAAWPHIWQELYENVSCAGIWGHSVYLSYTEFSLGGDARCLTLTGAANYGASSILDVGLSFQEAYSHSIPEVRDQRPRPGDYGATGKRHPRQRQRNNRRFEEKTIHVSDALLSLLWCRMWKILGICIIG